jgi:hypothetical protein
MEMTNDLLSYEVPQVEVIEVEVEKGFAVSGDDEVTGSGFGRG